MSKETIQKKKIPTKLFYTEDEVKDWIISPIEKSYGDGLNVDELKNLTDADKYYYNKKNFEIHKTNIKNNISRCRERCSKISGENVQPFDFEACKKGCHIESPYYCSNKECPNEEWYGKMFYYSDKNTPFKGDCSKSGDVADCELGKKYFREGLGAEIQNGYCSKHQGKRGWYLMTDGEKKNWIYKAKGTGSCGFGFVENCHKSEGCFCSLPKKNCDKWNNTSFFTEEPMYKISNRKLHGNECIGDNKFYKDTACDEEITFKERYGKLLKSYEDYETEDKGTYNNMKEKFIKLQKKNFIITSSNNIKMDSIIGKLKEGFRSNKLEIGKIRLEDNKLIGESEMYKKIAISVLGITLLLITSKKLNNL